MDTAVNYDCHGASILDEIIDQPNGVGIKIESHPLMMDLHVLTSVAGKVDIHWLLTCVPILLIDVESAFDHYLELNQQMCNMLWLHRCLTGMMVSIFK